MDNTRNEYEAVIRNYETLKRQNPDLLVLMHWDDRVELYNRDAERFSQMYGLRVTDSDRLADGDGIPWKRVSFPPSDLDRYMKDLESRDIDFAVPFSMHDMTLKTRKNIGSTEEMTTGQQGKGTRAPSHFILRHDAADDRVNVVLPSGETGAFIRPDRTVEYGKNARFTAEQRNSIEDTARRGNLFTGDGNLALEPLSRTGYIYDNPKETAVRMKVVIEEVNGETYAVSGRRVIPSFDGIREHLRPERKEVYDEIEQRGRRYLSAFRFRLYRAYMTGDAELAAGAERNAAAAYRYALQDRYSEGRVQDDIGRIRRMAEQDGWLVYSEEAESAFTVYVRPDGERQWLELDLEDGRTDGPEAQASKVGKDDLEAILQELRARAGLGTAFQVRDAQGRVRYDTSLDISGSMNVSAGFRDRGRQVFIFTPNERTAGIDIAAEGRGTCLHIRPDRRIEKRDGYRIPAADMASIREFARTGNMLFQGSRGWTVALDPLNGPSRYFDDFAKKTRFPVSVETVEGVECAIHDRILVARGDQVMRLPEYTDETVRRSDDKARAHYEKCRVEVVRTALGDDIEAEEKAVRDYLDAEKYLHADRYDRHEAGCRLKLIGDTVRDTLRLAMRQQAGKAEKTGQGRGAAAETKEDGKGKAANIQLFRMDDGHYGICETRGGVRSRTRRLSDEDKEWFFNGIKDIPPQEQDARRQALAEKYLRQGYVPKPAARPAFPDIPEEVRNRIGKVTVLKMGVSNYAVRAVIDGRQHSGKLIRRTDQNMFFENYSGRPADQQKETLARLAAVYFKEELCERELDFGKGYSR